MKRNGIILSVLFFIIVTVLAACGAPSQNSSSEKTKELLIYSSRNEEYVKPMIEKFQKETGIKVKLLSGDESLTNRLLEEKANPQADLFLSNDTGAMEYLRIEGVLAANNDKAVEVIDKKYRAEDNSWIGLSARTRGFIYNKKLISEEELPKTMEELADPKWKGKFAITRGGNGSFIAHVAALRAKWGDKKTEEWLKAVAKNAGAITKGHGDIRKAVGSGEFVFGLVNNYYYHQQLKEPKDNQVGFIYPDQNGMGSFVNASGIALIKGGANQENAKEFIRFLLKKENMKEFSYTSMEVPILPGVEVVPEAKAINEYKVMDMPLTELGPVWNDAKQLIEKAGLPLEIQ